MYDEKVVCVPFFVFNVHRNSFRHCDVLHRIRIVVNQIILRLDASAEILLADNSGVRVVYRSVFLGGFLYHSEIRKKVQRQC
jgi:hypothetical protein